MEILAEISIQNLQTKCDKIVIYRDLSSELNKPILEAHPIAVVILSMDTHTHHSKTKNRALLIVEFYHKILAWYASNIKELKIKTKFTLLDEYYNKFSPLILTSLHEIAIGLV